MILYELNEELAPLADDLIEQLVDAGVLTLMVEPDVWDALAEYLNEVSTVTRITGEHIRAGIGGDDE